MKPRFSISTDVVPVTRQVSVPVTTMETYVVNKPVVVMQDTVVQKPKVTMEKMVVNKQVTVKVRVVRERGRGLVGTGLASAPRLRGRMGGGW